MGMLDQMSGGRHELAFGRGALAAELRFFDVDPGEADKTNQETIAFVLEALRSDAVTVSEDGGKKRKLPLAVPGLQKPHPPLWYGVHSPQSGRAAAGPGMKRWSLDRAR